MKRWASGLFVLLAMVVAAVATAICAAPAQGPQRTPEAAIRPHYDPEGALQLPPDYRRWVFVGSSLGLSYTDGQPGMEMFHETLMEPTAYQHFVDTGTFREGTMLALILHGVGEGVLPARRGRFGAGIHGVEMAVKDSGHRPEGWAYYNFGGMDGIRSTARAMPKETCYSCHAEHAQRDNVFLQFYPMLAEAARLGQASTGAADTPAAAPAGPSLAVRGLDPVLLVAGREERGKAEIIADHKGRRYQFVSEPNRKTFVADAARYSIQNDTCLVVRGAPLDPDLFVVHEGRIYGFATADCVSQFKARPEAFVRP